MPADRCDQCGILYRDYPLLPGETAHEAVARYFPQKPEPEPRQPERDLVMVKPGRKIGEPEPEPSPEPQKEPMTDEQREWVESRLERVRATPAQKERLAEVLAELDSIDMFMREQRTQFRLSNKDDEITYMREVRTTQIRSSKKRLTRTVVETEGHRREVKKIKTTVSKLEKDGRITRGLAQYLYLFAQLVAAGTGAATDDRQDSTNRLTGSYEGYTSAGGFQSKTPSDIQLYGLHALQEMKNRIPPELIDIFNQIIDEEVEGHSPIRKTLSEIGDKLGYKHKQASPSGAALVYATVCLIAHFMREKGIKPQKSRQSDADSAIMAY
jgi:hypothetical protein